MRNTIHSVGYTFCLISTKKKKTKKNIRIYDKRRKSYAIVAFFLIEKALKFCHSLFKNQFFLFFISMYARTIVTNCYYSFTKYEHSLFLLLFFKHCSMTFRAAYIMHRCVVWRDKKRGDATFNWKIKVGSLRVIKILSNCSIDTGPSVNAGFSVVFVCRATLTS